MFCTNQCQKIYLTSKKKIKDTLDEINSKTVPNNKLICHVFIDDNYFSKSAQNFFKSINEFIGKCIKIYIVNFEIIEYTNAFIVSNENLEKVNCILDFEKSMCSSIISKNKLMEFIKDKFIEHYCVYVWNT